jgi:ATP-dependent exoDNAse (exonuclease V) alpha subunit
MTYKVENIELDNKNIEFNNAAEFVLQTDKLVYLTGKAGTGKTTFLKYIKNTTNKNTVILAPTGVAAINAGGVTIHSFFQIPFGPFIPDDSRLRTKAVGTENKETIHTTFTYRKDKLEIIKNLELLIIDEISMVRADTLDVIDNILKVFRNKPYLPFGGVQVILIGDTFQLSPIATDKEWAILSQFYKTPFFFSSKIIEQNTPLYIELKKIYRQNEQEFIDLLNKVRINEVSPKDLNILNSKYDPTFSGKRNDYIILATHNNIVNETNSTKLDKLKTELFTYKANVTGIYADKPTDHYLKLKVDAQIMFIKNDTKEHKQYYNGKIGKIKELEENSITVIFGDKSEVKVERSIWDNIEYTYNKDQKKIVEKVIGTFEQFPIRLAWAITVHKSQGLTFEKVIADLGCAFASGQVYVALSRCTSFNGLVLKTQLNSYSIKTDQRVIEFARNETPETLITKQLNAGKADFYYKKARKEFINGKIKSAFNFFKQALKFRNDIDTDVFNKFIEIYGTRLCLFKQKNSSLKKQLDFTKNELSEIKECIELQTDDLVNKSIKISEQSSSIDLLLKKTSEFEEENKRLKKELEQIQKELSSMQINSNRLENKLLKADRDLQKKNEENKINKLEIERLRNLKWYDKLIGKK